MSGWRDLSESQLRNLTDKAAPKEGRVKGAVKVDDPATGKKIHSKKEAKYVTYMRQRFHDEEIEVLALQVWFRLEGSKYIADVVSGQVVMIDGEPHLKLQVDDAKGFRTEMFKRSKAQMRERYGIEINEV